MLRNDWIGVETIMASRLGAARIARELDLTRPSVHVQGAVEEFIARNLVRVRIEGYAVRHRKKVEPSEDLVWINSQADSELTWCRLEVIFGCPRKKVRDVVRDKPVIGIADLQSARFALFF